MPNEHEGGYHIRLIYSEGNLDKERSKKKLSVRQKDYNSSVMTDELHSSIITCKQIHS